MSETKLGQGLIKGLVELVTDENEDLRARIAAASAERDALKEEIERVERNALGIAMHGDVIKKELSQEIENLTAENEKLKSEVERLKTTLPTFIKLDPTTEALTQSEATLEFMKQREKDLFLLRDSNSKLKDENWRLDGEIRVALKDNERSVKDNNRLLDIVANKLMDGVPRLKELEQMNQALRSLLKSAYGFVKTYDNVGITTKEIEHFLKGDL